MTTKTETFDCKTRLFTQVLFCGDVLQEKVSKVVFLSRQCSVVLRANRFRETQGSSVLLPRKGFFETDLWLRAAAKVGQTPFVFGCLSCHEALSCCWDGAFASVLRRPLIDNAITL